MVGCVLASPHGAVLGEGWHIRFGGAHAEPTALQDAADRQNVARGAIACVTLEPCCHTNKKTPPCAPRLIAAGVARVVVGCLDPNPDVNGKGIAMLRAAGIEVEIAPPRLRDECRQLIAPFVALTTHRRPYVTLKWAETADGHVAGPRGQRLKITNAASDLLVHTLRARCDAIAVGTNTVLSDDPLLTARGPSFDRVVRRVVMSNTLKIPLKSRLVQTARQTPTIVYCSERSTRNHPAAAAALTEAGVELVALPVREGDRFSATDMLGDLAARGVAHLLIEPGPTLARHLLGRSQADRVWVFRSPRRLDAPEELAISRAPHLDYPVTAQIDVEGDVLTEYLNPASDVFFAPAASADIELTRQG